MTKTASAVRGALLIAPAYRSGTDVPETIRMLCLSVPADFLFDGRMLTWHQQQIFGCRERRLNESYG